MKAQRFFSVTDTYGRHVEVSQGTNEKWFCREYCYNGYGMGWSKWEEYECPSFETHGENKYSGEKFEYKTPVALWGYNKMEEHCHIPRVRLP